MNQTGTVIFVTALSFENFVNSRLINVSPATVRGTEGYIMKKLVLAVIAGTTALTMSTAASATTLFDQTNIPTSQIAQSFTFTGLDNQTSLSFAGYNVPSFTRLNNLSVQLNGIGANLLSGNYTFTPAATGSDAYISDGNLNFGATTEGLYDTYSTMFASMAGSSYTLTYNLDTFETPNGLRITTTGGVAGAVPEPATWALMILGMGAVGFAMRRRKNANANVTVRFA